MDIFIPRRNETLKNLSIQICLTVGSENVCYNVRSQYISLYILPCCDAPFRLLLSMLFSFIQALAYMSCWCVCYSMPAEVSLRTLVCVCFGIFWHQHSLIHGKFASAATDLARGCKRAREYDATLRLFSHRNPWV